MKTAKQMREKSQKYAMRYIPWSEIKKRIKIYAKQGEMHCTFSLEEFNAEKYVSKLECLGYKVSIIRYQRTSCLPNSGYYTISWEYPLEYWEDDMFKPE